MHVVKKKKGEQPIRFNVHMILGQVSEQKKMQPEADVSRYVPFTDRLILIDRIRGLRK